MIFYNENGLQCPNCHLNYLHQDKIEVFSRIEDSPVGIHAVVLKGTATLDHSMEGNPSSRRAGVRIEFFCEGCDKRSELTISQHKGITYLETNILWEGK